MFPRCSGRSAVRSPEWDGSTRLVGSGGSQSLCSRACPHTHGLHLILCVTSRCVEAVRLCVPGHAAGPRCPPAVRAGLTGRCPLVHPFRNGLCPGSTMGSATKLAFSVFLISCSSGECAAVHPVGGALDRSQSCCSCYVYIDGSDDRTV